MTYSVPDPASEAPDPPLPRHAAPEGVDAPSAGGSDLGAAADEPLRVAHDDTADDEKFVADPEAAAEATRARMDAQAEAEKAAAGISTAAKDS
jgi:hypothetical protein